MKTINVSFEDAEIKAIEKAKDKQSWRNFILERAAIDSSKELHSKGINADALRGLCLEYDLENGEYPETNYEGFSLLCFFLREETQILESEEDIAIWEKQIAELEKAKEKEGKE